MAYQPKSYRKFVATAATCTIPKSEGKGMNIQLGEDYMIKSDSLNYILYKKHVSDPTHRFSKGEAKESWDVVGYFGKLKQLVEYLIELEIKESEAESVRALSQLVRLVGKMMVTRLEGVEDGENQSRTEL